MGKTHLLKILFSVATFTEFRYKNQGNDFFAPFIKNDDSVLSNEFMLLFGGGDANSISKDSKKSVSIWGLPNQIYANSIFIPVGEMLSWFKGFISAYENRESSIDYVYYLLAKKLAPLPLKGDKLKEQKLLIQELENELGFEVVRDGDEFLIAFAQDQVHNTKLVASGINKLAQLFYLIMNGSLTKDSIIFWDEPEAGLNPKYIVLVAKFLQTIAKAGCQIFVATHDYLLSHTLSLAAEYRDVEPETPAMRFHSLYKTPEGTQIESAEILPEIQHNSILDEYARFYKIEEDLFYQSMKVKEWK